MQDPKILYMVVPCYNEQEVLPITAPMFLEKIIELEQEGLISSESRILFVNDGSKDKTWEIIQSLSKEDPRFLGKPQPRTSECRSGRPDGGKGILRYHNLY